MKRHETTRPSSDCSWYSPRQDFAVSYIFTAPTTGSYTIGIAIRNFTANAIDNTDFGHVSAIVFN
jgi:hypothetical protein